MGNETSSRSQLEDLLDQIHIMKSYVTEQGISVPAAVAEDIGNLAIMTETPSDTKEGAPTVSSSPGDRFLNMDSKQVSTALQFALGVHTKLSVLIKPATPQTLMASMRRTGAAPARLRVTDLLFAATAVSVVAYLWAGQLLVLQPDSGFRKQISYLAASLLGASFAGLYTAFKYISTRTFDPVQSSTYIIRLLLGTVSGFILANFGGSFVDPNNALFKLAPTVLALLGGYSADAVNLMLQRVADTLSAAVKGSGDEEVKAKQSQLKAESKAAEVQRRQAITAELAEVLPSMPEGPVRERLKQLMSSIVKGEELPQRN